MKRREFCSIMGGSIVIAQAEKSLAALSMDAHASSSAATKPIKTASELGLENETVRIAFDAQTGELVSLRNVVRGDEYLKDRTNDGGPFRIFSDFRGEFDVSTTGEHYAACVDPADIAGTIVDPLKCRLVSGSFRRTLTGGALDLAYEDTTGRWRVDLEAWLPDHGDASEWNLKSPTFVPLSLY